MKPARLAIAVALFTATAALAEESAPPPAETPPPAVLHDVASGAWFDVEQTVVWQGRTQVIPFRVTPNPQQDRHFTVAIEGDPVVRLVSPPVALAGEKRDVGYLRVRGLTTGKCTLKVGDKSIAIEVRADATATSALNPPPRIDGPADGSVVWGEVTVGVHLFHEPSQHGAEPAVTLATATGSDVPLVWHSPAEDGPTRRYVFTLDTTKLEPGPVQLIATAQREGLSAVQSEPVTLHVLRDPANVLAGEAESLKDERRPERYGKDPQPPLAVRQVPEASGGAIVVNNGPYPPLTIPVKVEQDGWYQLALVVSSDYAGGAYPTIGIRVDEEGQTRTMGRLLHTEPHRAVIGRPFKLDAGEHRVVTFFENDFYAPGSDRNLRTDRYELLRLDGPPPRTQPNFMLTTEQNLEGRTVASGFALKAKVEAPKDDPPRDVAVTLFINGKPAMTQHTATPIFPIDRTHLRVGRNTIELEAKTGDGLSVRTPPQTFTLAKWDGHVPPARQTLHYPVTDAAWEASIRGSLSQDGNRVEPVASFYSATTAFLVLPEDLAGRFEVRIDARGDSFEGHPLAQVALVKGDGSETAVGEIQVGGGYQWRWVGGVTLAKGPKKLRVTFPNDHYGGEAKKDRNLHLAAVRLREIASVKDLAAPVATIIYPKDRQTLHGVDALVADVADDTEASWAELLIDGEPTGVRVAVGESSRVTLPVPLRGLAAGEHTLGVRVSDDSNNIRDVGPRKVVVSADAPEALTPYQRAVRLLDRFGYGAEGDELAAVLTMGEEAYLRDRLWRTFEDPAEQSAWINVVATHRNSSSGGEVERRAVRYALTSPNPVRARFVMWANNHFSTWLRKTGAERKADEFESLARVGPGPFLALLCTSAQSPAMLYYLDQHRSFNKRINENYAREIMELHTLGVNGGYEQRDVTQLAHLLTGWMLSEQGDVAGRAAKVSAFHFSPPQNDPAARDVFGLRLDEAKDPAARYDRIQATVEMLASHPSTAKYICQKLVEHYVAIPAPQPMVDELAKVFLVTGGDLREVLVAIAKRPEFWEPGLRPRLTTPFDYAIRLGRAVDFTNPSPITGYLHRAAVGMFDRDTPDGYPEEDEAYTDSNVTLQRWRFVADVEYAVLRLLPTPLREKPEGVDEATWRQRVVDTIAINLTGRPLGERSNEAALKVLAETETKGTDRAFLITNLVAQMPEAMLR